MYMEQDGYMQNCVKNIVPGTERETWWLFNFIPLFRVKQITTPEYIKRKYRLFGFIPLFSTETRF